jgi:D,D-heptose 1,7-bisphosphate phosphatase
LIKQAAILVGGYGKRLGHITKKNPKPLIRINGTVILDQIIKNFSRFGIEKIILLCHYKANRFFKKYHKKSLYGLKIECVKEPSALGTGGALKYSLNKMDNYFLLCNGDTYFDINYIDFFINFNKTKFIGAIALSKKNAFYSDNNIKYKIKSNVYTSSGVYIFNKKKIKKYLINKKSSLENEIITSLVKKKIQLITFDKDFIDIGTRKNLNKANNFIRNSIKKRCIFLDRDGIVNHDYGYVYKKSNFRWRKHIIKLIKLLNNKNYYIIVVTNQSGVGRGYYTEEDVCRLHKWINQKLYKFGAHIDRFYFSPFYENSKLIKYTKYENMRKPNTGMLKKAFSDFSIIKKGSIVIGDKITDMELASNYGLKGIQINKDDNVFNKVKKCLVTKKYH